MHWREVLLAILLTAWWALSALNQFRGGAWTAGVRRYLPRVLVPSFIFFAPPPQADLRLVWRNEVDGRWGEWDELYFGFAPAYRRWLFNPEHVEAKMASGVIDALLSVASALGPRGFLLTSSYVALLSLVVSQCRERSATGVQFAVVRTNITSQGRRLDVAFVSEIHDASETAGDVC